MNTTDKLAEALRSRSYRADCLDPDSQAIYVETAIATVVATLAANRAQQAAPSEPPRFGAGDAVRIYEKAKAVFRGCGQESRDVIEWYHSSLLVEAGVTAAPPKQSAAQPQQAQGEAVAWAKADAFDWMPRESECVVKLTRRMQPEYGFVAPLYTAPQPTTPAERLPLTDEQIVAAANEAFGTTIDLDDETLVNKYGHGVYISRYLDFARAIEAAHGIGIELGDA